MLLLGITRLDTPITNHNSNINNLDSKTSSFKDNNNLFDQQQLQHFHNENNNTNLIGAFRNVNQSKTIKTAKNRKSRSLFELNRHYSGHCGEHLEKPKNIYNHSYEKVKNSSVESLTQRKYQIITKRNFPTFFAKIPKTQNLAKNCPYTTTILSNSSPTIYHLVETKKCENDDFVANSNDDDNGQCQLFTNEYSICVTEPSEFERSSSNNYLTIDGSVYLNKLNGQFLNAKTDINKRKNKQKKKKTSRFSVCLPNCGSQHEPCDPDSLTSSFRIPSECYTRNNNLQNTLINYCKNNNNNINKNNICNNNNNNDNNPNKREENPSVSNLKKNQNNNNDRFKNNNNNYLLNNLNIMDKSVDSIGSCSLDVDAESTDFSGSRKKKYFCFAQQMEKEK